jgi:hypothetical protein
MLQSAYDEVYVSPWYGIVPGICIVLISGAYMLIAHGLRVRHARGSSILGETAFEGDSSLLGTSTSST